MNKKKFIKELKNWTKNYSIDGKIEDEDGAISIDCFLTFNDKVNFEFYATCNYEDDEVDLRDSTVLFVLDGFSESLELYRVLNVLNLKGDNHFFYNFNYVSNNVRFLFEEDEPIESISDTLDHALNAFSNFIDNYENDYTKEISDAFNELFKLRKIEE